MKYLDDMEPEEFNNTMQKFCMDICKQVIAFADETGKGNDEKLSTIIHQAIGIFVTLVGASLRKVDEEMQQAILNKASDDISKGLSLQFNLNPYRNKH